MKIFTPAVLALALLAPAVAQSTPEPVAYICYYNAAGKFTSAKPAEPGKVVPANFQTTGRGGDQALTYGIKSVDGSDCPKRVRS